MLSTLFVNVPSEQMKALQEKQSLTLQHQQSQCQMLMKQLQSQMEAEMRMKSELVRNQMEMLAQNGGDISGMVFQCMEF